MILGTGIDLIEISRIKESVERLGDAFLQKVYTQNELEYSLNKKNKYQHLAVRFAAKEAVAKALSDGWEGGFRWHDIEIMNNEKGKPEVKLKGKLKDYLGSDKALSVSLSHTHIYATAIAILSEK